MVSIEREQLIRTAKSALASSLWQVLGRRNLVRLGRFLSNQARLDVLNDLENNGELLVQRVVLERASKSEPLHVVDVGANVGDWSAHLLGIAEAAGWRALDLHCFEPAPAAFERLSARLATPPVGMSVERIAAAASSKVGEATLHLVGDAAGVNSLYGRDDMPEVGVTKIQLTTLDEFARSRAIERLALVKCDTEGHDVDVIEGSLGLLRAHKIDVMQFEYNWRWIDSRHYLRDVFSIASPLSYRVGKVTPRGIELYRAWHEELESFREGNYLLLSPRSVQWFPVVRWWND